jgi:hypothetical protein
MTPGESDTMNDMAVLVSSMPGVGDVSVTGDRLFVSMDDPDRLTPSIVRLLVHQDMEILRVAEVEYSLERAYLDLVSRQDQTAGEPQTVPGLGAVA